MLEHCLFLKRALFEIRCIAQKDERCAYMSVFLLLRPPKPAGIVGAAATKLVSLSVHVSGSDGLCSKPRSARLVRAAASLVPGRHRLPSHPRSSPQKSGDAAPLPQRHANNISIDWLGFSTEK